MSNNKFKTWMIVFEKDNKRLENFNLINSLIQCNKFSAIDSINNYKFYSDFALQKNYTTKEYINHREVKLYKGKIGCNLSHQMLLEQILNKNLLEDWYLILEDDITIKNLDFNMINNILQKADDNNSDYIQLFTHPKFLSKQKSQESIYTNLYKMIPQYHTTAYFINKKGIKKVLEEFPIILHIDKFYNSIIKKLNSLCWINDIFINEGSLDNSIKEKQNKKKFGSLIYKF